MPALLQKLRSHKLIANASIYVTGNFLQRAIEFLLLTVFAYFLTPEDYGITGTMNSYGGVLFALLMLGLSGSATRHYYDYTEDRQSQKEYVSSLMAFQLAANGALVLLLNLFGPALWERFSSGAIPFDPYVRLIIFTKFLQALVQVPTSLYQAQQKARQFVAVNLGGSLLNIAAMVLLVVSLRLGAYGQMMSNFVSAVVMLLVVGYFAWKSWFTLRLRWEYVRKGLAYGLPLVPHALAGWALEAANRMILEWYVPLAVVGQFNFGYTLGMAFKVLVMSVNQAWSPYYFSMMKKDPDPHRRTAGVLSIYVALIGGICVLGTLFAGEVVHLVIPAKYFPAIPYIAPVFFGYFMLGLYYFSVLPLFYLSKTRVIPIATGSAALINVALNLLLVPRFGAIASAWITSFTYAVMFLFTFLASRRYQSYEAYPLKRCAVVVAVVFGVTLLSSQLGILEWRAALLKVLISAAYGAGAILLLVLPGRRKNEVHP